jgi:hypothetical protein
LDLLEEELCVSAVEENEEEVKALQILSCKKNQKVAEKCN